MCLTKEAEMQDVVFKRKRIGEEMFESPLTLLNEGTAANKSGTTAPAASNGSSDNVRGRNEFFFTR